MPIKRIVLSLVVLAAIAGAVAAVPMSGGNDGENPDPAIRDAEGYAAHLGVSLQQAQSRLTLQKLAGDLDAELSDHEGQTFAGLWIEHTPQFRVVVQFTRDADATIAKYNQSDELAAVLETRTADVSLTELREAQSEATGAIRSENIPTESQIDIKAGKVKVFVAERARLDDSIQKGTITLPDKVDLVTVPAMSRLEADIYGGLELSQCTSGFAVKNSAGTKGITTAGHCDEDISYGGTDLPFQSQAWHDSYDIQWHKAPGFTVLNKIQSSSSGGTRSITGTVGRGSQSVGAYVCKYGSTTNYTCGYIETTSFRMAGSSSATLIRVDNTAGHNNLSENGDSGGPWFLLNDAWGTHVGAPEEDLNDAIYMAVNYISALGVDVMTSP